MAGGLCEKAREQKQQPFLVGGKKKEKCLYHPLWWKVNQSTR